MIPILVLALVLGVFSIYKVYEARNKEQKAAWGWAILGIISLIFVQQVVCGGLGL